MPDERISLCVLLWAHAGQEEGLANYENFVLHLLPDHGGRVVRRGRVESGDPGSPTEVQFLELPNEGSLDAYLNDPRRLARAPERDAAIEWTQILRLATALSPQSGFSSPVLRSAPTP
jgi:hypothetical protein